LSGNRSIDHSTSTMTLRISANGQSEQPGVLAASFGRVMTQLRRLPPLFLGIVVAPTIIASIYYLFIASPIYISQAQFVVRAASAQQTPTGLGAVLQGVGLGPAETDSFAVQDYIMSRDAISELEAHQHLREALAAPGSDFLSRFPRPFQRASFENLAQDYPRFVNVTYNSSTGISTLQVKAFRPQDAQQIASALLEGSEQIVNRLNDRADQDAVTETHKEIAEAEMQLAKAEQNLTAFRNRERLIDPTRSSAVNLELMGKLQGDIAALRAERAGIAAAAPKSPDLPGLDDRIRAYEQQADAQQAQMAGETGSLAPMIGEYERLTLERDFADKELATSAAAADQARLEARRKRLYLERIVNPNLADAAVEPHRTQALLTIVVSLLLAYGTVALILAGFREHRQ
jgi:capsular polysaccharide transport system permease protein